MKSLGLALTSYDFCPYEKGKLDTVTEGRPGEKLSTSPGEKPGTDPSLKPSEGANLTDTSIWASRLLYRAIINFCC